MAGSLDILGSLLGGGMTTSAPDRIERSLSDKGVGGEGGFLDQILGASQSPTRQGGGAATGLKEMISSIFSDPRALRAGGLGALAGAIFGRGAKGAVGGGALALLGSLALKALQGAQGGKKPQLDPSTQLEAGLRPPANHQEQERVESQAELLVAAMANAAKADGQIDQREIEHITGKVQADEASRRRLMEELRQPMDTDRIVRAANNNPQLAAQVYAASLLAINVDTEAERRYLADLAAKLRLDPAVVQNLHDALGV